MKKLLIIIGILSLLFTMPAMSSIQIMEKPIHLPISEKNPLSPPLPGYDGTFVGGLGQLNKVNGEWQFDAYAYLAGSYKLGVFKRLTGVILNLDEEQTGYMWAYFGNRIIIGFLQDMENNRAPIIGFLLWNNEEFAGRIMTMFGPATHIIGQYTPNT
jgi:hypothetical protein